MNIVELLASHECNRICIGVLRKHCRTQVKVISEHAVFCAEYEPAAKVLATPFRTSRSLENHVSENSTHSLSRNRWQRHEWHRGSAPHVRL